MSYVGMRGSLLAAALSVFCAGCSEDAGPVRVATFNLGLAFGYVEEAPQRVAPIADAINEADVDVLCVQELWTNQNDAGMWSTEVIEDILGRTTGTYGSSYWERTVVPSDAPLTGCEIEEADLLLACAEPACGAEPPENLADCVLANCDVEFNSASALCQNCMVSNLGMPLESIVSACRGITRGGVVYDGHNGLALLSKHPLSSTDIVQFDYSLTSRAALHATVDLPGHGKTDVYCTHLASDLSPTVAYPENSPYASFVEENLAQTDALLSYVDQTAESSRRILMGDFNHGPGGGSVREELPGSYARVTGAGYDDPVASLGQCTFCDSNLLLQGQGDGGEMIDHVYLDASIGANATAEIGFDDPVDIVGIAGDQKRLNLSDHFGVIVEF